MNQASRFGIAGLGAAVAAFSPLLVPAANATPPPPGDTTAVVRDANPDPSKVTQAKRGVFKDANGDIVGGWRMLDSSPTTAVRSTGGEENVGGGTWKYGTYTDSTGYKQCWSHYYHKFNTHRATSVFWKRDTTSWLNWDKDVAKPGGTAKAESSPLDTHKNRGYTCMSYWDNK